MLSADEGDGYIDPVRDSFFTAQLINHWHFTR